MNAFNVMDTLEFSAELKNQELRELVDRWKIEKFNLYWGLREMRGNQIPLGDEFGADYHWVLFEFGVDAVMIVMPEYVETTTIIDPLVCAVMCGGLPILYKGTRQVFEHR